MSSPKYVTTEFVRITALIAARSCKRRRSFGLNELWKSSKIPLIKAKKIEGKNFKPNGIVKSKSIPDNIPIPPALGVGLSWKF